MQMDYNSSKFFFTKRPTVLPVFYYTAQQELKMRHNPAILEILNKAATL